MFYLQHGFFSTGAIFSPQHFGAFVGFSTSDSAPQTLHLIFILSPHTILFYQGLTAINLILSTFPSTALRSSSSGAGVNSSPGQIVIAHSSSPTKL